LGGGEFVAVVVGAVHQSDEKQGYQQITRMDTDETHQGMTA